jgi:predicted RNA polymerase sigma factor
MPSPIVALNRSVAVCMAFGPEAALSIVEGIVREGVLDNYAPLYSVHADLLAKLQRLPEASAKFERAAALTRNEQERALCLTRAAACARGELPAR